jgi:DNA-directed RNA polymerase specialized sigma24 family protein
VNRDPIDFHAVRFQHEAIHLRLLNWARWAGSGRGGTVTTPMFRLYRTSDTWCPPEPSIPIDSLDGHKMEKAVAKLPEKHMCAIRWQYVFSERGMSIYKACRVLAVRQDTLHQLVQDARSMLKNRSV